MDPGKVILMELINSGAVIFPMTEEERRKLKIESWRVKALFRDAYERYQQRNRDDGSGKGTGRAQAPSR